MAEKADGHGLLVRVIRKRAGILSIPARFCACFLAAAIEYSPTMSNAAAPVASNVPVQVPFL
jgi:hypothetical protein